MACYWGLLPTPSQLSVEILPGWRRLKTPHPHCWRKCKWVSAGGGKSIPPWVAVKGVVLVANEWGRPALYSPEVAAYARESNTMVTKAEIWQGDPRNEVSTGAPVNSPHPPGCLLSTCRWDLSSPLLPGYLMWGTCEMWIGMWKSS